MYTYTTNLVASYLASRSRSPVRRERSPVREDRSESPRRTSPEPKSSPPLSKSRNDDERSPPNTGDVSPENGIGNGRRDGSDYSDGPTRSRSRSRSTSPIMDRDSRKTNGASPRDDRSPIDDDDDDTRPRGSESPWTSLCDFHCLRARNNGFHGFLQKFLFLSFVLVFIECTSMFLLTCQIKSPVINVCGDCLEIILEDL